MSAGSSGIASRGVASSGALKRLVVGLAVAAAACGGSSGPGSALSIGVYDDGRGTLRSLLTVTATAGDWSVVVEGDEVGSDGRPGHTGLIRTPRSGVLRVEAVLAGPGGGAHASGAIALDIRPDWAWGVDVFLTDDNPADLCFGCTWHRAFPVPAELRAAPDDSLYLVWGGNRIRDPVVY